MDIFDTITPDGMIQALEQRMAAVAAGEDAEVARLRQAVAQQGKDAELWFDYAMSLNQSALQYTDMAVRLAEFKLHQSQEEAVGEAADATEETAPEGSSETEQEPTELQVDISAAKPLYEQALAAFAKVLEIEPEYYGVQTQMGTVYGNLGMLQEAEQCYLRALEEDEEDFSAAYYLGCTYRDMGNEEQAARYFAMAHELNPEDEALCNCRGQVVEQ